MQVRCPHCRNPMELIHDHEFADIECPSCGSNFSLLDDQTTSMQQVAPSTVGHFELVEQVGVGAFGSVWKANDTELDRTVAVKIPRRGQLDSTGAEQFLREARSAAQLKHPNIVPVHEVGRDEGQTYIVSDFIEGLPLSSWLTGKKPTFREAAELCAKIAIALHHAHEAGVIHRDLKPSNIMLDSAGEPHIMDFGLAKREAGEITMTVDGKVLGTPAYMSPEQARGEAHAADRRTDVYSLGVILYEMVSGEKPFRGDYRMLLHQVLSDEAPSPRRLRANVPRDLETVCLKCLEKTPEKRYGSAKELAEELHRYLDEKPILARPIPQAERVWRWSKRNRLAACLAVTGPLVAAVMFLMFVQARHARNNAERARTEAREAESDALESRDQATEARQRAEASQLLAEQLRDESNATVDKYFTAVSEDALLNAPGMQELRRQLLEEAKAHYERYAEETEDSDLGTRRAEGRMRLGLIAFESRDFAEALAFYQEAANILSELPAAEGLYGDSLNGLGRVYQGLRRRLDSIVAYSRASIVRQRVAELAKQNADQSPGQVDLRFNYVVRQQLAGASYMNVANMLAQFEPPDLASLPDDVRAFLSEGPDELATPATFYKRAIDMKLEALEAMRPLQAESSENPKYSARLGAILHSLGLSYLNRARIPRRDEPPEPEELDDAVAHLEEARRVSANDLNVRYTLASCYLERGRFRSRTDREGARPDFHKARILLEPLVFLNPDITMYRVDLARLARRLGQAGYNISAEPLSVLDDMRAAERIFEQIELQFPGEYEFSLTDLRRRMAEYEDQKLEELRDQLRANEFGRAGELADLLARKYWMDATKLSLVASLLVDEVPEDHRDLAQAQLIAQRANDLHEAPDGITLSTIARIAFLRGEYETAVAEQRRALEHAPDDRWTDMRDTLRTYETQLEAREDVAATSPGKILPASTELLPASEVDPRVTLSPNLAIFVSVGRTRTNGAILQFDSRGMQLEQMTLPNTTYGLTVYGNSLLASTPVGTIYRISADGTVAPWFSDATKRPLALAARASTGELYFGDNASDVIARLSNSGEFTGELGLVGAASRFAQDMALAVRSDGVLIGASRPWGVFLVDAFEPSSVRKNVLLFSGKVAADPSSNRWAATQPDGIHLFELDREVGFIAVPEESRLYESGGPLAFGPNGESLAMLKEGMRAQIVQLDWDAGEYYRILSLPNPPLRSAKAFAVAPLMKWPLASDSSAEGDSLEVLGFDRRLPTTLRAGAPFTVKIAYDLQSIDAAEVVVLPLVGGKEAGAFVSQGAKVVRGSGTAYAQVHFEQAAQMDQVRVIMRHAEGTIAEVTLDVDARWRGEPDR